MLSLRPGVFRQGIKRCWLFDPPAAAAMRIEVGAVNELPEMGLKSLRYSRKSRFGGVFLRFMAETQKVVGSL